MDGEGSDGLGASFKDREGLNTHPPRGLGGVGGGGGNPDPPIRGQGGARIRVKESRWISVRIVIERGCQKKIEN